MAAFAHPSRPASSVSPRSTRATARSRQLPNGACNWRDLNLGREANSCGCRQFWLNDVSLVPNGLLDQRQASVASGAWCFCGHHACFHRLHANSSLPGLGSAGQENDDTSWGLPENFGFDINQAANPESLPQGNQDPSKPNISNPSGLGLFMTGSGHQHIMQTHPSYLPRPSLLNHAAEYLPSTQSSPKLQSHSASDPDNHLRHSPSSAFANHVASQRQPAPQVSVQNLPPPNNHEEGAQSATEIATPSYAGTPALRETEEAFAAVRTTLDAFNRNYPAGSSTSKPPHANLGPALHGPGENEQVNTRELQGNALDVGASAQPQQPSGQSTIDLLMAQIASLKSLLSATPKFGASLLSLNHRLEALESASFAHVPVEELQEKFEFFDIRLLDVESKVEELEKLQAAQAEERPRFTKAVTKPGESFGSNASCSGSESRAFEVQADQEYHQGSYSAAFAQLSRLEQRLISLEAAAVPTPQAPWEVEVVFIPWGRGLQGVWAPTLEASQFSKLETQDTGVPLSSTLSQKSASHAPASRAVSAASEWTNESEEWLSPRACGPTRGTAGRIYERLKSRGFVRTVQLLGNSARKVEWAICSSFSDLMVTITKHAQIRNENDRLLQRFLGLQAPFIPLRKVHKSSRLRHLTHAEMVTPSLWTAEFLNSSVFMQTPTTGHRRLFVTTSASYTQDLAPADGWTWQMLRELPRASASPERANNSSRVVAEADANEPCWAWDPRLDPPVSVHSSFSSGISYHSSLDSHPLSPQQTNVDSSGVSGRSDLEEDQMEEDEAISDDKTARPRSPITPVSEFPWSRQSQRHRTVSLPPDEPEASLAASVPKRQIASFEHSSTMKVIPKRRRFSRTPDDVELMAMWSLTPRRSREPLSPGGAQSSAQQYTSNGEALQASVAKGRLTPQAYATPFSNNNILVEGDEGELVGDTDADSESEYSSEDDNEAAHVDLNDEAWEGVDEDVNARQHIDDDDDDDDDDDQEEDQDEEGDGMHDSNDEDDLAT